MKNLKLLIAMASISLSMQVNGQQNQTPTPILDTCKLSLLTNSTGDSTQLRWVINLPIAWNHIRNNGFWLERAELGVDTNDAPSAFNKLTSQPIKTLAEQDWKTLFKDQSKTAAMAQTLLFKETQFSDGQVSGVEGILERSKDLSMRFGYTMFVADQDMEVAKALGLGYTDKMVKKNKGYLYKLYSASVSEDFFTDTAYVFVESEQLDKMPVMRTPAFELGDQAIILKWVVNEKTRFSSFYIERAEGNTDKFIRLNEAPFVNLKSADSKDDLVLFTDSVQNYQSYTYRIIGVTPFGALSKPSFPVTVMARDLTPPAPAFITKVIEVNKNQLKVEWTLNEVSSDLKALQVVRSNSNDGEYKPVSTELPASTVSFIDNEPVGYQGVFYKIHAIDTAGNYSQSLPFYGQMIDSFPPTIPIGLQGYIDTNSVVHIQWNLNKELDLQGYRVYYSNSPDHEFSNLTPYIWVDTLYNDTIQKRTLSKHIYYSIAAVDFNYNHSKMSPWVKIRRLDEIPPTPPIFYDVEVRDSSIFLAWHNSSSDDVSEHLLLKRMGGEKEWKTIAQWKGYPLKSTFIDKNVAPKTFYEYALAAIDSSQLRSNDSPVMSVRTFDRGIREGIKEMAVKYDKDKKNNTITWDYNKAGNYSFLIYRNYKEFGLTKYVKVAGKDRFYADKEIIGSGDYTYAIKVIYDDGGESPLSEKVNVLIE